MRLLSRNEVVAVSIVVQNVSESPIYLKKGIQVARLVPALPVPLSAPALVSEGVMALEAIAEPLSVVERQAKLLEKLDLSGLKSWAPRNAEVAEQLVLSYHDIFVLDKNKLGCTSTVEHEICIVDSEPFKERFRRIPPPLLEEVRASLRDMLDAGAICPSHAVSPSMLTRLDAASKRPILKCTSKPTSKLTGKSEIMIRQQALCSLCREMPF